MQKIIVGTDQYQKLLGVTPWHVFYADFIPIDGVGKPLNYLFTTYSGTSPVSNLVQNPQKVGGLANFRYDFEKGLPVIKRYEIGIEYLGGSLIAQDCTSNLNRYEHHIYGISWFDPIIWDAITKDWKLLITDFFTYPREWKREKTNKKINQ